MKSEQIEYMLNALQTVNKELTKWEESFLESITEQFEKKKTLSQRQVEILEKIYAEKTS